MSSTIQQVFQRPARRPTKTRRHRPDRCRFESLEARSMLAITGMPDPGDLLGFPITLATDGTGPNALAIALDDSSGTLIATITANTAGGTITRNYSNFNRSISFSGSFDTDGSEVNAVTLTAPFGVALKSDAADFYRWVSTCAFPGGPVTVTTDNADSLAVRNPAGGAAGGAPSSIDGTFTSPSPGTAITFESNSPVTLGAATPVQTYDLTVRGVNSGTISAIELQDTVTVVNNLVLRDANLIAVDEDLTSVQGSITVESTAGAVIVTKAVAAANGSVSIKAAGNLDVSGATGLTAGGASGSLTLVSSLGSVALMPTPLSVNGDILVQSAKDLAVAVDVTSLGGDVTLASTQGALVLTAAVTVPAGSVRLEADQNVDLSGATGLTVGPTGGSITLLSTQGKVLFKTTAPAINLVAPGNITVRAGQELKVEVDVTSTAGAIDLASTGESLRIFNPVTATTGSVTLGAGAAGVVQVSAPVSAGTNITSLSGGEFNLDNSLTTANGAISVTVTGVGSTVNLGAATGLTAGGPAGSLTLISQLGGVVLKSGLPLQADQNVTVRSHLDFELTVPVTSRFGDVEIKSTGGDLDISQTVTVLAGDLVLEAAGAIDDGSGGSVGILLVAGTTTLTAGAGQAITLDNATGPGHDFTGAVSVVRAGDVKLADQDDIVLGTITISGGITVNAVGITQVGPITQTTGVAPAIFEAGAGVITLTAANDFRGPVSLVNTGAFNVAVRDVNRIDLGASSVGTGTLAVTANGIVQSGAIVQAVGAAGSTFDGGTDVITLTDVANEFRGPVSLNTTGAGAVTVTTGLAIDLGTSSLGSGALTVTAAGITQSGPITQVGGAGPATFNAGNAAITLTNAANEFTGAVSLNNTGANDVAITDKTAITLGVSVVGSGTLTVVATGIAQAGPISQAPGAGAATFDGRNGPIALTDAANDFQGPVSLRNTGPNAVAIVNAGALELGQSSVGTGTLSVTAVGISQSGKITQAAGAGAATFDGGTGAIDLTNSANDFTGPVSLRTTGAGDVAITDVTAIQLGASTLGIGTLSVTAVGITQVGALVQAAGAGAASFDGKTGEITLSDAGNDFRGPVSLKNTGAADVVLVDVNAVDLGVSSVGNGLLSVTAIGITQSGAITQAGGAIGAIFDAGTGRIALTLANEFTGPVTLTNSGANDVAITDATTLDLAASSVGTGTLRVTAVGITQSGAITQAAGAGAATFDGGAGGIDLTAAANDFTGPVSLNGTGAADVAVTDKNAIVLGTSTLGTGTLSVTATGIGQVGAITQAPGAAAAVFRAGAAAITLTADNDFTGPVSLFNSGANNVAIRDITAIDLGASTVGSGTLSVTAVGITQSGPLVQAPGAGAASFNGGAGPITLDDAGNDFTGPVTLKNTGANDVSIRDANDIEFGGTSTIGGDLTVVAVGSITDGATGALVVQGTTSLTAGGDIILDNAGNDFVGDVKVVCGGDLKLNGANDVSVTDPTVVLGDFTVTAGTTVTVRGLTATGDVKVTATTGNVAVSDILSAAGSMSFDSLAGDVIVTGDLLSAQAGTIDLSAFGQVRGATSLAPVESQLVAQTLTATARDGNGVGAKLLFTNVTNLVDQVRLDLVTDAGVATGTEVEYVDADSFTVASLTCALGTVTLTSVGGGISVNAGIGSGNGETLDGVDVSARDAIAITGTVRAGAGAISLASTLGDVQVTGSLVSSPDHAITVGAGNSITIAGIVAAGLDATLSALDAITLTGSVKSAAGNVSIKTDAGNVQSSGTIESSPDHAVTVRAGDSITLTGTVSSGLTATLSAANLVTLGDAVSTTFVTSISEDVSVDAQGAITVTRTDVSAPLGSIFMLTPDTLTFDDGSLLANLDYTNAAFVVGLVRLEAPNGIDVVNSPLVRAGRLEIVGGGGGAVTLNDTLNDVDTIQVETGGDFIYYQELVPLAIDDPDDTGAATIQVSSTGGSVSITSRAGLRVVDGIAYTTTLSLIGRETGADPGVEFVVTSADDNPSPPAAPHPLSFAGTLRDMFNYVNANSATNLANTGNAAMRVVFDDARAPTKVSLDDTLPQVVKTITFDGIRLDGTRVELDGSAIVATTANGLSLGNGSTGSVVQNAYVYGFKGAGVAATSGRNVFRSLTLGDDADAAVAPVGNGIGILLSGSQAVQNVVGIQNAGDIGNTFRANTTGLAITGGANFTTVRGNGIYDSAVDGIAITQSIGAIIGSDVNPLLGNEIADNGRHGIYLENVQGSSVAYGATIQGNKITGNDAGSGIRVTGGGRSLIGGTSTGAANLIAGNVDGVRIEPSLLPTPANNVQVYGNTISANSASGVHVQAGFANIVGGNAIAGNAQAGVRIVSATATKDQLSNVVVSNTVTGNGNAENNGGIVVQSSKGQAIGVDSRGRVFGNTVTGNGGSGIVVVGNSTHNLNSVVGNTVSTSAFDGVRVAGAVATLVRGNTSTGNTRAGIVVADAQSTATTGNVVQRNVSAGNATGIQVAGSRSTLVGGPLVADANFVHSNTSDGIRVEASASAGASQGTFLRNNVVGVTPGSEPAGNTGYGIRISEATGTTVDYANVVRNNVAGGILVTGGNATMIGSPLAGRANTIAANTGSGVTIQQSARLAQQQVNVTVAGNRIESNGGDGIVVTGSRASAVTIGRAPSITVPNGTGNTIRDNTGAGIRVNAARNVTMIGNSIYDNDLPAIVLENGGNGGVVAPTPIGAAIRRGNARDPQWDIRGSVAGSSTQRFYVDIYMDVVGGGQVFMGRVLVQGGKQFRVVLKGPTNGLGAAGIRATSTASSGGLTGSTSAFSAAWG